MHKAIAEQLQNPRQVMMKADNVVLDNTLFSESQAKERSTTQQPNVNKLLLWATAIFIGWVAGQFPQSTTEIAFCQVFGGSEFCLKFDMKQKYGIIEEAYLENDSSCKLHKAIAEQLQNPRQVMMKADNVVLDNTLFSESSCAAKTS